MAVMPTINVRTRTTLEDGTELKEKFEWPWESDIRARSWEQNHAALSTLTIGESITWEYQGHTFKTTVIERRDAPEGI